MWGLWWIIWVVWNIHDVVYHCWFEDPYWTPDEQPGDLDDADEWCHVLCSITHVSTYLANFVAPCMHTNFQLHSCNKLHIAVMCIYSFNIYTHNHLGCYGTSAHLPIMWLHSSPYWVAGISWMDLHAHCIELAPWSVKQTFIMCWIVRVDRQCH